MQTPTKLCSRAIIILAQGHPKKYFENGIWTFQKFTEMFEKVKFY